MMTKLILAVLVLVVGCGGKAKPSVQVPDGGDAGDGAAAEAPEVPTEGPAVCPPPQEVLPLRIDFGGDDCPTGDCGYLPNGPLLNGTSLEESDPDKETVVESVPYASVVAADGTRPVATFADGELVLTVGGQPVPAVGATMEAVRLGPGGRGTARLRIDGVEKQGELFTYDLSYEAAPSADPCVDASATAPEWRPLCTDGDRRLRAVLVNAVWNYSAGEAGNGGRQSSDSHFTVACLDTSAIAKCIQIGYRPWARRPGCAAGDEACLLAAHHQACVRAVRADFCNNGFPLTDPGTPVRIYDTLDINPKRPGSQGEASWRPDGSLCISETRLASIVGTEGTSRPFKVRDYIEKVCPGKFTAKGREPWAGLCVEGAADVADGDQIFTEFPLRPDGGAGADASDGAAAP